MIGYDFIDVKYDLVKIDEMIKRNTALLEKMEKCLNKNLCKKCQDKLKCITKPRKANR